MLGSPSATSEGGIAIVTNERWGKARKILFIRKTGGIDGHFEGFWEVLDSSWGGNWVYTEIFNNTFYISHPVGPDSKGARIHHKFHNLPGEAKKLLERLPSY